MTTGAMVLGVVPLLIASGAGAVSRSHMGLVIAPGFLSGRCSRSSSFRRCICSSPQTHSKRATGEALPAAGGQAGIATDRRPGPMTARVCIVGAGPVGVVAAIACAGRGPPGGTGATAPWLTGPPPSDAAPAPRRTIHTRAVHGTVVGGPVHLRPCPPAAGSASPVARFELVCGEEQNTRRNDEEREQRPDRQSRSDTAPIVGAASLRPRRACAAMRSGTRRAPLRSVVIRIRTADAGGCRAAFSIGLALWKAPASAACLANSTDSGYRACLHLSSAHQRPPAPPWRCRC